MQNPRYKCVTLKAYTAARTKTQPKIYYIYNIIEQCVGILSSSARDRISTLICEFMDKTPQITEEQLVMTIDKAQETKLQRYKS